MGTHARGTDQRRTEVRRRRGSGRGDRRIEAEAPARAEPRVLWAEPPPQYAPARPSPWDAALARAMARTRRGPRERLGNAIGRWWAPVVHAIARLRGARMFHPEGLTFAGRAIAIPGPLGSIGAQLAGRVLARCSAALSRRGRERCEVLGIALRFRPGAGPPLDHLPTIEDQDLLFATVWSPLTLPLAPFLTRAGDFLWNRYWGVSPFTVHEHGRVELRLQPIDPPASPGPRAERLRRAVADGRAAFWLEARRTLTPRWHRVARIELEREVEIDQRRLRFSPFRTGGGLMPVGFVHALRRATYDASQRARYPARDVDDVRLPGDPRAR